MAECDDAAVLHVSPVGKSCSPPIVFNRHGFEVALNLAMTKDAEPEKGKHEVNLRIRDLKEHHVLAALRRLEAGEGSQFSESTTYDLLDGNTRYPPKRVVGLALEELTGRRHMPGDFIGGELSVSFRLLEDLGFRIVGKTGRARGASSASRPPKYGRPSWQLALDAVHALNGRATRQQIRDHIVATVPTFNDRNVDPDLSLLTVNSFARGNFGPNSKPRRTDNGSSYDALYVEAASSGAEYVLYDARRHGIWELAESADENLLRPRLVNELGLRSSIEEEQSNAERSGAFDALDEGDARRKVLAAIVRRQGQTRFRRNLIRAYKGRCAVTGCPVLDVLEAAHIKPYLGLHTNKVQNGLLLRTDVHTLFDLGLLRVDPERMTIAMASRLIGLLPDVIHGAPLRLPDDLAEWPDADALRQHGERSIAF